MEFLFWEGESTANIQRRLVNAYRKAALNVNTVNSWVSRVS